MIKREDVAFFSFLSCALAVLITMLAGCVGSLPTTQTVTKHRLECHDTKDPSKIVPCPKAAKAVEQDDKDDAKEDAEDKADEAKASKPTPAKAAPAKAPTTPAAKSAAPTPANDADEEATKGDLVQLEQRTDRKIGAVKEIALDAIKVEQLRRQKEKREAIQATAAPKAKTMVGRNDPYRCANDEVLMRVLNYKHLPIMVSVSEQPIVGVSGNPVAARQFSGTVPGQLFTCLPNLGTYRIGIAFAREHGYGRWIPVTVNGYVPVVRVIKTFTTADLIDNMVTLSY
jgi:hypothetical protein